MFKKLTIIIIFALTYIGGMLVAQTKVIPDSLVLLVFVLVSVILIEFGGEIEEEEVVVDEPPIELTVSMLVDDLLVKKGVEQSELGIKIDPDIIKFVDTPEERKKKALDVDLEIGMNIEEFLLELENDPELIEQLGAIDNIDALPEIEEFPFTDSEADVIVIPDDEVDGLIELIEKEV